MNLLKEVHGIITKADKLELETEISENDKWAISRFVAQIAITAFKEGLKKKEE